MMRTLICGCVVLLVAGCHSMNIEDDVPAVIANPDDASRAALRATLNGLFIGQDVLLADDALTTSSELPIEFGAKSSIEHRPLTGRVVTEPLRFRLVRNGSNCFLIDPRDASRHLLADTRCVPE
jgi:hypothetical protein